MITYLKKKFFKDWFPNWSPEIALRYLPIVSDIKKYRNITSILDVGSGSLGITPYLKRSVIGVDINFNGPHSSLLKQVKGSATKLPFANKSFDVSLCVDTFEHISKKLRKKSINELLRVTKKKIYITIPCGKLSTNEDKYFYNYLLKKKKYDDPYLREHLALGLPTEHEIIHYFPPEINIRTINLTNIFMRRILLKVQFSSKRVVKFISSVIFIILLPFFLRLNFLPTYRKLFIITIDN